VKLKPVPADLVAAALHTMQAAKFPMLASVDGAQARVRPVSPVRTERFTVYVASMRSSHKTRELEESPLVELCYLDDQHDQVRITGTARRVLDAGLIASIWQENPLLRAYLGSPENPEFMLYCVEPSRVRFMREWALDYHEVAF